MISILCATRKRPVIFKNFCQSVLDTANHPEDVEFIVYMGLDDRSPYEYIGNHKIVWGKNKGFDGGINDCIPLVSGSIFGFFPDDVIFETKGWDDLVKKFFDDIPDKIGYVYPVDNLFGAKFGATGFVHKTWIDVTGHFLVSELVRRGDVWLNLVSKSISRRFCLHEMRVRNLNIVNDETHKEYEKIIEEVDNLAVYKSKEMLEYRMNDIRKLKRYIRSFNA